MTEHGSDDLIARVQQDARFPAHGWLVGADGSVYLVFPIFRAINDRPWLAEPTPLSVDAVHRMSYFKRTFWKILVVLGEIARAERVLLSDAKREGAPVEEWAPWVEAHEKMPIWIDSLFRYFKVLANRLSVVLGPLVCAAPGCFPDQYKTLLATAQTDSVPKEWKAKIDADGVLAAIRDNSGWYRTAEDTGKPGTEDIRDAIEHRLAEPCVGQEVDQAGKVLRIVVSFEGAERDVPKNDLFAGVPGIIEGLCDLLSALPGQLWAPPGFQHGDLFLRATDDAFPGIKRFFPSLLRPSSSMHSRADAGQAS